MALPHEDYTELVSIYETITEFKAFNTRPEQILSYVSSLLLLIKRHREALIEEGISETVLDSLDKRVNGYDVAQAKHATAVYGEDSATQLWKNGKAESTDLRRDLILYAEKAFHNHPDLLEKLDIIRDGKSNEDLIMDLLSLYELISANNTLITRFKKFNPLWLDRAVELHEEMQDLLALMNNPDVVIGATALREKQAETYLITAVHEIRFWGELAFRNDQELLDILKYSWLR